MKFFKGIVLVIMVVTTWNVVVSYFFDNIFKEPNGWIATIAFIFKVGPCVFIGEWVAKLQKHFDL